MRYFIKLAYDGTPFVGWQIQPAGKTVQGELQEALETVLRHSVNLVGCGRTDAGVHAAEFYAHFDSPLPLHENWLHRLNKMLPDEIAIYRIWQVNDTLHARFSATRRGYKYYISDKKDPFLHSREYHYFGFSGLDPKLMHSAAQLILQYDQFLPFCKAKSGVEHYQCQTYESSWAFYPEKMIFSISANRFLRGMVRLIVGMCLEVGQGKLTVDEVRDALDKQEHMSRNLSVPAHGLFLTEVRYPDMGQQID